MQTSTTPGFIPIVANTTTTPKPTTPEKVVVVEATKPSSEKPPIDDLLDNYSSEDINNEAKK